MIFAINNARSSMFDLPGKCPVQVGTVYVADGLEEDARMSTHGD